MSSSEVVVATSTCCSAALSRLSLARLLYLQGMVPDKVPNRGRATASLAVTCSPLNASRSI